MRIFPYVLPLVVLALLTALVSLFPKVPAASSNELAEASVGYILTNNHRLANETLQQALALDPGNYRANMVAGLYFTQTKRNAEARSFFEAALTAKPDDVDAVFSLGVTSHKLGEYERAAQYYLKSRQLTPTDPKIAYNLAKVCSDAADYPKAKMFFEEYLRLAPESALDRPLVKYWIREIDTRLKEKK